ncbi:MAG TPA: alpha/beta hydrolase [Azospira sp.]|nr:alpha/beta hydrolase [Azospira sp.]
MTEGRVLCAALDGTGLHRMAYTDWGDRDNPKVLICVHGLTRNGRDFDYLARQLSREYRVVCPDVVGRGRSDWLKKRSSYGFPQYVADMVTLIARLDVPEVHWLGTSMGGLIGMFMAALERSPVTRLILNDVGPVITNESLRRIGEYLGKAPRFASLEEAEKFIRFVSAPFGKLSDAQWRHLTETSVRQADDGQWDMRYDPGIAEPFQMGFVMHQDVILWPYYDAIRCPTLVIRGADSDLLPREALDEMARRGPRAWTREIPEVGHAPMFQDPAQVAVVREFLLGT